MSAAFDFAAMATVRSSGCGPMGPLRDADPDAPCGGFAGFNATAFSALWDIVQAGGL